MNKRIKYYEKLCDEVFERRDKTNYGYAVGQREQADILRQALHLLGADIGEDWDDLEDIGE